jgi:hypothetical protein
MSEIPGQQPLATWIDDAYREAGTCPPPEAFLADELAALSEEDRQRLLTHAETCPACAAERELAGLFDAAPAGAAGDDVEYVVAQLRRGSARVLPFAPKAPAARPFLSSSLARLAAAAVLVLAAGLGFLYLRTAPPPLPTPEEGTLRGGEITELAPQGDLAERPKELRWAPREGVATYRVRILTVDEDVLWEATVAAPPVPLPRDAASRLERGVVYSWTVEGLDRDGRQLALSPSARFRVRPGL